MTDARYVAVEVEMHGIKYICIRLYVPHDDKDNFLKILDESIVFFSYQNWYTLGHWNGVSLPSLIEQLVRELNPIKVGYQFCFYLMNNLALVEFLGDRKMENSREYTFFRKTNLFQELIWYGFQKLWLIYSPSRHFIKDFFWPQSS